MLDIKFIREKADTVRRALVLRNDKAPLDDILCLDSERRRLNQELEDLRRERKNTARQSQGEASEGGRNLRERIKLIEDHLREIECRLGELILQVPNIPQESVPHGTSEEDNVIVRSHGEPANFEFKPLPHWELGENLDIIDFERGVKLSGTRFYLLKGLGARLQRAVIALMLDMHTREHGYTEIYPPYMVKREIMTASGNLPKFADNLYHDDTDDLWFVPTAEVPLTSLHGGEILTPGRLPLNYAAYTACFRREKMSAVKIPAASSAGTSLTRWSFISWSNRILQRRTGENGGRRGTGAETAGTAYRIKLLCTADISFSSSKTYDIEVWAPGCGEWLEVSSCSTATISRPAPSIRYRAAPMPGLNSSIPLTAPAWRSRA